MGRVTRGTATWGFCRAMSRLPRIGRSDVARGGEGRCLRSGRRPGRSPEMRTGRRPRRYPTDKAVKRQEFGPGRSYWLFEPAEPTPARLRPVVVFQSRLVRLQSGGLWRLDRAPGAVVIVIFPRYQADPLHPSRRLPGQRPERAVRDALDVLETSPDHIRPDRRRFALIGHSAGGNLAARWRRWRRSKGCRRPGPLWR